MFKIFSVTSLCAWLSLFLWSIPSSHCSKKSIRSENFLFVLLNQSLVCWVCNVYIFHRFFFNLFGINISLLLHLNKYIHNHAQSLTNPLCIHITSEVKILLATSLTLWSNTNPVPTKLAPSILRVSSFLGLYGLNLIYDFIIFVTSVYSVSISGVQVIFPFEPQTFKGMAKETLGHHCRCELSIPQKHGPHRLADHWNHLASHYGTWSQGPLTG